MMTNLHNISVVALQAQTGGNRRSPFPDVSWIDLLFVAVMLFFIILAQNAFARHDLASDPEAPCYEKVQFNPSAATKKRGPPFFRHIWGHSHKQPYFRYLGGGYIGVRGSHVTDGYANQLQWRGSGEKSHTFVVVNLRYRGIFGNNVQTILEPQDQIAFIFVPRRPEKKHFVTYSPIPYIHAQDLGNIRAVTTIEDSIKYIERGGPAALVVGRRKGRLPALWGVEPRYFPNIPFRTLHTKQSRVQIGGKTHTDTVQCRFGYWPLAATNHDKFQALHRARTAQGGEEPRRRQLGRGRFDFEEPCRRFSRKEQVRRDQDIVYKRPL